MINIKGNKHNKIFYECDCGFRGLSIIKPLKVDGVIVTQIRCPSCDQMIFVTVMQYSSEESAKTLMDNIDSIDFSWEISEELGE